MRTTLAWVLVAAVTLLPGGSAVAMSREATATATGYRMAPADPDARLEELAAAGVRGDRRNGHPPRSARHMLRDDPNLQAAFAWLDNR